MTMQSIRTFDIEVDISDRLELYDYGQGRVLRRPASGIWDSKARKSLTRHASTDHIVEEDENFMLRVGLMDHTWMDAEKLEKQFDRHKGKLPRQNALPDTVPEDEEVFSLGPDEGEENGQTGDEGDVVFGADFTMMQPGQHIPRRLLPIYRPGEVVKGVVLLDLKEPMAAERLILNFLGQMRVNVRTYTQFGSQDNTGVDDFIDETHTLWETSKNGSDISEAFTHLDINTKVTSKNLPSGMSRFPFQFTLPSKAPGSIPPLIPSSVDFAYLVYRFKATIDRGKSLARGNAITHRGIWVDHPIDISKLPEFGTPANTERVLDTGVAPRMWKSGQVTLRVSMPRKAWVRGEFVSLIVEVDNQAKSEITAVKARVILHGKVLTSESHYTLTHPVRIKSAKVKEGPISPGMNPKFQWLVPLNFSEASVDSNLVPTGRLHASKLLDLRYDVIVKLKRKGLHRNLEVAIPILVGTTNSKATPK